MLGILAIILSVALHALRQVAKKPSGSIYRYKGVILAVEAPSRRAVLQVVGRRAEVALFDEWDERAPRTQIVATGAYGSIDPEMLTAQFEACLS